MSERAPAGVSRDYGLHEEEERPLVRIKSSGESVAIHAGVRLVNVRTDISISRNVSECRIIMDRRLEVLTSDGAEFLRTTDASLNNIKAALFGVVVGAAASPFVGPAVGGGIGSAAGFGASEFLSRTAHPWSFGDVLTSNIAWIGTQYRETGLLRGPRRGPVKDRAPIGRLRDARKHPWKEWSPEHRKSWSVLGWTERSWTENVPPPSELLAWSELSEPEQRAARKLGFNKLTWQAREGSWVPDAGSVVAKDETALHLFGAWAVEYERDPMRE